MQVGVSLGRFYTPASSYRHPLRWDFHSRDRSPDASARGVGAFSALVLCGLATLLTKHSHLKLRISATGQPTTQVPFPARSLERRRAANKGRREARGARPGPARVSPAGGGGAAPEPAFLRSSRSPRGDVTPGSAPVPPRAK